jgi:integrase
MLQWLDPETGRRKSKSAETADPKVAEDRRVDHEADLNAGRYAEASRMTWDGFRELFEREYVAPLRPGTQKVYANVFNLFERVCNPRQLRSITERTVSAFAAGLRKLPARAKGGGTMQPSTLRARLQFLHTALQWAAGQGLLPKCPKFPEVKVPKRKPQPVPAESFERLLAKGPDDHMRAFLLCGWLAGLRIKEALFLEWEPTDGAPWLDLAADRIRIPAAFSKAAEDQWVPLDRELRAALDRLPRQGRYVFPFVLRTGRRIQPNDLSARISALARSAGVRLTYHSLRKGFGCRYAAKVPAQVLQRLMRHSNVSITMAYYANVDDAVMNAVLGGERNDLRNNTAPEAKDQSASGDVSPYPDEATGGDAS